MDFANMAAPGVIRLGARQKSTKYGLGNIYAKYGAFGRILTKYYIYCTNSPDYKGFSPELNSLLVCHNKQKVNQNHPMANPPWPKIKMATIIQGLIFKWA